MAIENQHPDYQAAVKALCVAMKPLVELSEPVGTYRSFQEFETVALSLPAHDLVRLAKSKIGNHYRDIQDHLDEVTYQSEQCRRDLSPNTTREEHMRTQSWVKGMRPVNPTSIIR